MTPLEQIFYILEYLDFILEEKRPKIYFTEYQIVLTRSRKLFFYDLDPSIKKSKKIGFIQLRFSYKSNFESETSQLRSL